MTQYQYNYTDNTVAEVNMYNKSGRQQKADKIIAILDDYLGKLDDLSMLDLSCSTGMMTEAFSAVVGNVCGIDIDQNAVDFAKRHYSRKNVEFFIMDALYTDFPDNYFDVIICNQMYEHVPNPQQLMGEIHRLLVPGGVCYFGATSRLKVIETHYGKLPFLSYLPKSLAHLYLRVLGKGNYYYETLYTYWNLRRLVANFDLIDYTVKVVTEPEKFHSTDMFCSNTLKQHLALIMSKVAYKFLPGYIWLLRKKI